MDLPKTPRAGAAYGLAAIALGDRVTLPEGQIGILKYIGPIEGKAGEFAGVELVDEYASMGRHNGEYSGHQYFTTDSPMSGLFISYPKLVRSNSAAAARRSYIGRRSSFTPTGAAVSARSLNPTRSSGRPSSVLSTGSNGSAPSFPLPTPTPTSSSSSSSASSQAPNRLRSPQTASTQLRASTPTFKRPPSSIAPMKLDQAFPSISADKRFSNSSSDFGDNSPSHVGTPSTPLTYNSDYFDGEAHLNHHHSSSIDDTSSINSGSARDPQGNNTSAAIANAVANAVSQVQAEAQREIFELRKKIQERDAQLQQQSQELQELEKTVLEVEQNMSNVDTKALASSSFSVEIEELKQVHQRELEAALEERDRKFSNMKTQFDEKRNEFRKTIDALQVDLQESNSVYVHEIQTLQSKLAEAEKVTERVNELEQLIQDLELSANSAAAAPAAAATFVNLDEQRDAKAQFKKLADAENKLLENEGRLSDLMAQLEDARGKIAILEAAAASVTGSTPASPAGSSSRRTSFIPNTEAHQKQVEELKKQIEELKKQVENLTDDKEILGHRLEQAQLEKEIAENETGIFKQELQKERKGRLKAEQEMSELLKKLAKAEMDMTKLEEMLEEKIFQQTESENACQATKGASPVKTTINRSSPKKSPSTVSSLRSSPATPTLDALFDDLPQQSPSSAAAVSAASAASLASIKIPSSMAPLVSSHTSPPPSIPLPPPVTGSLKDSSSNGASAGVLANAPDLSAVTPTKPVTSDGSSGSGATKQIDLADGRDKWCGLCERDGHDSLNCPFEKDFNDDDEFEF